MSKTEFRDVVIAGLRERGWPEPVEQGPNGEYSVPCQVWRGSGGDPSYPVVWMTDDGIFCGYDADHQETCCIEFDEYVSVTRVIEAIDRLRWVFWDWRSGTK